MGSDTYLDGDGTIKVVTTAWECTDNVPSRHTSLRCEGGTDPEGTVRGDSKCRAGQFVQFGDLSLIFREFIRFSLEFSLASMFFLVVLQ